MQMRTADESCAAGKRRAVRALPAQRCRSCRRACCFHAEAVFLACRAAPRLSRVTHVRHARRSSFFESRGELFFTAPRDDAATRAFAVKIRFLRYAIAEAKDRFCRCDSRRAEGGFARHAQRGRLDDAALFMMMFERCAAASGFACVLRGGMRCRALSLRSYRECDCGSGACIRRCHA